MRKTKILVGFIALLCMLFIVFECIGEWMLSYISRGLIVPSITLLFFINKGYKICSFTIFLLLYSLSDLLSLLYLIPFIADNIHYLFSYFSCNGLYALSYCFLVYTIVKSLNIKIIVKNYFIHLLVLGFLNAYLFYRLYEFTFTEDKLLVPKQIFIELPYNILILLILSTSLINFIYWSSKKSLFMFLGCLCLVFVEVIQIAFLHSLAKILLDVLFTALLVLGFYLFYRQAFLVEEETAVLSGNEV